MTFLNGSFIVSLLFTGISYNVVVSAKPRDLSPAPFWAGPLADLVSQVCAAQPSQQSGKMFRHQGLLAIRSVRYGVIRCPLFFEILPTCPLRSYVTIWFYSFLCPLIHLRNSFRFIKILVRVLILL
jgi:hypothetical protein